MTAELAIGFLSAFIGALGVLFAVGAIVAGVLLYRQGRDHKEQIQAVVDGANRQVEAANRQIESAIQALRQEQEGLRAERETATEGLIAKLGTAISRLEAQKLPEPATSTRRFIKYGPRVTGTLVTYCEECGFQNPAPSFQYAAGYPDVQCLNCGHVQKFNPSDAELVDAEDFDKAVGRALQKERLKDVRQPHHKRPTDGSGA